MPKIHPSLYEPAIPEMPRNRMTCSDCDQMATWYYMPADGHGHKRAFCEEHVPRGCSCRGDESTDEWGRALPCVEYGFDDRGFPKEPH